MIKQGPKIGGGFQAHNCVGGLCAAEQGPSSLAPLALPYWGGMTHNVPLCPSSGQMQRTRTLGRGVRRGARA